MNRDPDPGSTPSDGGWFGRWSTDEDGLDCLDVEPNPWRHHGGLVLPEHGFDDCWHQVASPDVTATAHVGGWTTLWEVRRGTVALTGRRSWWGDPGDPVGWHGRRPRSIRWGRGYAEWTARSGTWEVTRRVSAPLGPGLRGSGPLLRVDVTLHAGRGCGGRYAEAWVPEAWPLLTGGLMSPRTPPPPGLDRRGRLAWRATFALTDLSRRLTLALRGAVAGLLQHRPEPAGRPGVVVTRPRWARRGGAPSTAAAVDLRLPAVAVALVDAEPTAVATDVDGPTLVVTVPEGVEEAHLTFVVALLDAPGGLGGDDGLAAALNSARETPPAVAAARQLALLRLRLPDHPVLAREAGWHATHLVGAEQADDAFGARYPAQGSAYGFVHGLQGAPRDYAISVVALAAIDPPAAADALRVIVHMTGADGTIGYAHTGRGLVTSGIVHAAPTDLALFFLWAVAEYVDRTGDHGFLDERVPGRGTAVTGAPTVRERVVGALAHVAERVGTGPHGLLRVGSGDWADPISAMVRDRRSFHRHGESGFNTAMACHVLPQAAELVGPSSPQTRRDTLALATGLRTAMEAAWTGAWFLRGWDGRGGPVGDRHLFLDGQVWALIARIGTDEQRATLVESIRRRCMDPSPVGATILDRPHPVRLAMLAPGWDCNGGVWAALNGLLAWGLAGHDEALAWECLERQSLAAHARAYPHVWFGVWSGPDAYNAHFGSRPGETFVQPATPMQEYPVMNSNAHAGPLLGLMKVLGVSGGRA